MPLNSASYHVALITPLVDLSLRYFEDVGCEIEDNEHLVTVQNRHIHFHTVSCKKDVDNLPAQVLPVLLLRFVDVISLNQIAELIQSRPGLNPLCVLIYRNEQESDFKMSCPTCGQKLWVHDSDKGKRGQCPQCQKGFTLPPQDEHIRAYLSLRSDCTIVRVTRGEPDSLASSLDVILQAGHTHTSQRASEMDDSTKNETMIVKVPLKDIDSTN